MPAMLRTLALALILSLTTTVGFSDPKTGKVKEIIASHILQLESGESIRLLGIEPTRKVDVRRKAREYLENEVKGKEVRLEYDRRTRDEMGRWLAYVFVERNPPKADSLLQEDLLWRGYVYSAKKYPCKRIGVFQRYEKEARKAKRGVWEGL